MKAVSIIESDRVIDAPDSGPVIAIPLGLPNGITLSNRIAKAAMSEHLGDLDGAPTRQLDEAYRAWSRSGAGLLITGNVSIDGGSLEAPRNVVIEDARHLGQLRRWASAADGTDAKIIVQLSHPGRQTMRGLSSRGRRQDVVAPSAIKVAAGGGAMFVKPRALADREIEALIQRFTEAAVVVAEAGFAGVQLHAAHGYLLNQFLSPLANQRSDRWGGWRTAHAF